MTGMWQSMLENLDAYEENLVSQSGMVGKDGGQMDATEKMRNRYVAILWQKLWQMH